MKRIHIIGGGVAGCSLAYYLKDEFDVRVYEMKEIGEKPCAWGVPKDIEKFVKIPDDYILNDIYGVNIYLDGEYFSRNRIRSYIIDKPGFLRYLVKDVDVRKELIRFRNKKPVLKEENVVIATGNYFHRSNKMLTVQYVVDGIEVEDMEVWFFSDLVGYIWVFPCGRLAKVGIGGLMNRWELESRLRSFLSSYRCDVKRVETAHIYMGGIDESLYEFEFPVIGEALGTVYPITGEGIRPSIVSAYSLAKSIKSGRSFKEEFEKTGIPSEIRLQKKGFDILVNSSPEERERYLKILLK